MNTTIRQSTNVHTLSGVLISSQSFNSNPLEAILQLLIGPERFLDLRAIQTSQRDAEKLKILLLTQKFRKKIDPKVYHMGLI